MAHDNKNQPLEINELIIDDPEVMALDSEEKLCLVYGFIGQAALTLASEYPDSLHLVFVRVGV